MSDSSRHQHTLFLAVAIIALGAWLLIPWGEDSDSVESGLPDPTRQAASIDLLTTGFVEAAPGLAAVYRSLVPGGATLTRVDAGPAFTLGDSSPHPRLAPGPFEVIWSGAIELIEEEAIRFGAFVGGEVELTVDETSVLQGSGESETDWIEAREPLTRPRGTYRLRVAFRSLDGVPARLQLWWEGKSFSREPLPAWRLKHAPSELPASFHEEQEVERGRDAVRGFGCARCHSGAFPAEVELLPGPSLEKLGDRVSPTWLRRWLTDPAQVRRPAKMPALFAANRVGFVERWILSEYLIETTKTESTSADVGGSIRAGRQAFVGLGCSACHPVPDLPGPGVESDKLFPLDGLSERMNGASLSAFLIDPLTRYPDGRMPRLPVTPDQARDLAAYLLEWSKPAPFETESDPPVTSEEIDAAAERLGVAAELRAVGGALLRVKGCARCHPGIEVDGPRDVPLASGWFGGSHPRYDIDEPTRRAITAFAAVAPAEVHPSLLDKSRRQLEHLGCLRCHQRDAAGPSPLEAIGSRLETPHLYRLPFQRTPTLTHALSKYRRSHLVAAVRDGVEGIRPGWYSYRMPAYGPLAEDVVQALAATDGDLLDEPPPSKPEPVDPTLYTRGPELVGFGGYSCVSCHQWGGRALTEINPGSAGSDLATVTGRISREWFDRWVEDPQRHRPGTPMPSLIQKGESEAERSAIWAYLERGTEAPAPERLPPVPVTPPPAGGPPLIAQIPLRVAGAPPLESLTVLYASHDALVYDLARGSLSGIFTGAQIERDPNGGRSFRLTGTPVELDASEWSKPRAGSFLGYDRLLDGVRLRFSDRTETLTLAGRRLVRVTDTSAPTELELPAPTTPQVAEPIARGPARIADQNLGPKGLARPGYRATRTPMPTTASGEDLVMPGALAVDPQSGKLYVASMKLGELFVLEGDRFRDYAGGLYQEAYGMLCEDDGSLYLLHRRNITRIRDTDGDGMADSFDRVARLHHSTADAYDWAYGLVRDRTGALVTTFAPHANHEISGSGSLLRWTERGPEEVTYGLRNPFGWCAGPEGELFFTDNQGEYVAANKLCHIVPGRFYGYPNHKQRQHADKPAGEAAVWIPYGWARSINGVAYDTTGGGFGPFQEQFFLAELMYGGAIVRANVEQVNGVYQGACFPFWGGGLVGPLTLAFDPGGGLYVGSITMPGWMGQPDRGALFRIDYTGKVPFEIQSIHVTATGFRLVFTRPVQPESALAISSYVLERYRYEYTGAYGSPELDRTGVAVERVDLAGDGRTVTLTTTPLKTGWVYAIRAEGVRSPGDEPLVHPVGVYTLHQIPGGG